MNNEQLSGDELYRYLHISKRKMKYLLENGYLPCVDTGKKTHQYLVKSEDAESFRYRMKQHPETLGELIGKFPSQNPQNPKPILLEPTEENCNAFREYWCSRGARITVASILPL